MKTIGTFMIYYWILLRTRNVSEKSYREYRKHTFCSLLSHRACCYIYFIQTNWCTLFETHSHL